MKSIAVVGVCWEMSLVSAKLYFLGHSCHTPVMCHILSTGRPLFNPALPSSLFHWVKAWKSYGPKSLAATKHLLRGTHWGLEGKKWEEAPFLLLGLATKGGFTKKRVLARYWEVDHQKRELFSFVLTAEGNDSNGKDIFLLWVSSHISASANIYTLGETMPSCISSSLPGYIQCVILNPLLLVIPRVFCVFLMRS